MFRQLFLWACFLAAPTILWAQSDFPYRLQLTEKTIVGLPGLHSYAYAQLGQQAFIFGGRTNGIHARQPFRAFPPEAANQLLYCIDWRNDSATAFSLEQLPMPVREQLSASNFNFHQSGTQLIITGGYGFSESRQKFITYPQLLRIDLQRLQELLQLQQNISPAFELLTDTLFAVTGGQLGKIGPHHYLVAGHRFDGRYNPMGPNHGPGFEQQYTNQIRIFSLSAPGEPLQYQAGKHYTDPVHLHRRDYNLVPQMFGDSVFGYTLFSGVFQHTADLPYLHPLSVLPDKMRISPYFLQQLSHYHSARVPLYDRSQDEMHTLFLGGISRFTPSANGLQSDADVPFVNTISRVTTTQQGLHHHEFLQPEQMPGLLGASAEFLLLPDLPLLHHEIISLADLTGDTLLLGHLVGGIRSEQAHAFSTNQTEKTSASATVYALYLLRDSSATAEPLPPPSLPYPAAFSTQKIRRHRLTLEFPVAETDSSIHYLVSNQAGQLLEKGQLGALSPGQQKVSFDLRKYPAGQNLDFTLVFNHSFFYSIRHFTTEKRP